jgi:hypothetical protein
MFITEGTPVAAIANDALIPQAVAPVWGHDYCAALHRSLHAGESSPLYSTGRMRLKAQQNCSACRLTILAGDIAARSVNVQHRVYSYLCLGCYASQHAIPAVANSSSSRKALA